jgi:hypothetical protein
VGQLGEGRWTAMALGDFRVFWVRWATITWVMDRSGWPRCRIGGGACGSLRQVLLEYPSVPGSEGTTGIEYPHHPHLEGQGRQV